MLRKVDALTSIIRENDEFGFIRSLIFVFTGLINYTTTLAYINVLYFYNFYDINILESTETRIIFALGTCFIVLHT